MEFQLTILECHSNPRLRAGRRSLFGTPLKSWECWRRNRERRTGIPDPVLTSLKKSTFQDPKPTKPTKPKN